MSGVGVVGNCRGTKLMTVPFFFFFFFFRGSFKVLLLGEMMVGDWQWEQRMITTALSRWENQKPTNELWPLLKASFQ